MLLESGSFENQLFLLHSSQKVVINVRVAKSKTEMKQKHKKSIKILQIFLIFLDINFKANTYAWLDCFSVTKYHELT